MKKSLACLLTLLTLLLCASAQAQTPQDTAANYQADAAHTGFVNEPGLAPPFAKKWAVNFGQNVSYPVIADGRVFVTVRNGPDYGTKLYALDAATGATLWGPVSLGGIYWFSALCYENGRVFAVNHDGQLTAFDAATGAVAWSQQLPGQYSFSSPPTAYKGVVYVGGAGSGGTLYAVNASTGALLWTARVANGDNSSPTVTPDGVYVSYACAMSYKFNPSTGAQLWNFKTFCSGGGGKTAVFYDGRLYVRDSSAGNHILDGQTGASLGTHISKTAPAFAGNTGFFTSSASPYSSSNLTLEARDLTTNAQLWAFAGDGYLISAPLVVNDHVLVGSETGMLYALKTTTGEKVWSTNVGAPIQFSADLTGSVPPSGFAAGGGLLVIPTKTTLVAFEASPDRVAPTLQWGAPSPAPSASGWNNTAVDIPYTTSDDRSAVVTSSAPNPLRIVSNGANQTRQVTVTDEAGNSATFNSPAVNIDMTAPVTTASASGPAGSGQWYTGPAQVSLAATDNLSGVSGTFYEVDGGGAQPYAGPFVVSGAGNHTVNYWSADAAGNSEQRRTLNVGVDDAAPTTQFSATGNQGNEGWFRTGPLQVTLTASDSLSGAASTYYSVNGGPTQTYAGPFDFKVFGQGRHTVSYWSVDKAGNTEAAQSSPVNVDYTGPDTRSSVSGTVGGALYYRSAVQVTLTPDADNLSGVGGTFYRVDDGPTQTYTGPFMVTGDGVHPVEFWSVDVAGNHNYTSRIGGIHIDTTAPTTQASVVGTAAENGWYKGPVQITLTASDAQSGIRKTFYSVDNGQAQYYTEPFTFAAEGAHTIRVWSIDEASNTDPQQSLVVNIDSTAPQTRAFLGGILAENGWWRGPVNVRLSASDAASNVGGSFYTVDGGATQTYTAAFNVTGDGSHTIRFWSVDVAGTAEAPQTLVVGIDTTAPQTQAAAVGAPGDGGWYRGAVQVALSAADAASQVRVSFFAVDGGAAQAYTAPFAVAGDGSHTVRFWSLDQAGNAEAAQTLTVSIDGTAPQTQASAAGTLGDNGWYTGSVQVTLSATDNHAGVRSRHFTVDGGAAQTYAAPFTVSGSGVHTVNVWSVDAAGNAGAPQSLAVKIDGSAPVINVAASPATVAKNKNPVNVTVTGRVTDAPAGVRPGSTIYIVNDEYFVYQPTGALTLAADGTYSFTVSLPATRNAKDGDGHKYTIAIRAIDNAGNIGTASAVVTIQ